MNPYLTIPSRTFHSQGRAGIAVVLRDHATGQALDGLDEDRITELLDFAELHGSVISLRDGVRVELTKGSWLADLFAPVREGAA